MTDSTMDRKIEPLRSGRSRRGFVGGIAGLAGLAVTLGVGTTRSAEAAIRSLNLLPEDLPEKRYRAAFSELGAVSTWVAHGIETTRFIGDLLGVEITTYDGELSPDKQLRDMQDIASQSWDFVAVHPQASDVLIDPARQIVERNIPLIVMDTQLVQDAGAFARFGHLTFIEPDNISMGEVMARTLFDAIGGEGQVIHTRGNQAHTGSQGRARGFENILALYPDIEVVDDTPANWDISEVTPLWQDLLQRFPEVRGGFLHSDDMALAAAAVVEQAGMQEQVSIVGIDGQRNACEAVLAGTLLASVINPSGRIHGWALWAGFLTASGSDRSDGEVPKYIRADGGPITRDNAEGYIWLGSNQQY